MAGDKKNIGETLFFGVVFVLCNLALLITFMKLKCLNIWSQKAVFLLFGEIFDKKKKNESPQPTTKKTQVPAVVAVSKIRDVTGVKLLRSNYLTHI